MASLEGPEFDPWWERTQVLDVIDTIYKQQIGRAAIQIVELPERPLIAQMIFTGVVEPVHDSEGAYYEDMDVSIAVSMPFDQVSPSATVWFNGDYSKRVKYNLAPERAYDAISSEASCIDAYLRDVLNRTTFKEELAQSTLEEPWLQDSE